MTVAVIDAEEKQETVIDMKDFEVQWFSGSGKGGQHRNKHQNSCRVIHKPTGMTEKRESREREANKRDAIEALISRLRNQETSRNQSDTQRDIKLQMGSGERGDKIRTYRFQDNITKDHRSGKTAATTKVMNGKFDLLW